MITVARTPARASARGSAAQTSARPPVLAKGATSEATCRTERVIFPPRSAYRSSSVAELTQRACHLRSLQTTDADRSWSVELPQEGRGVLGRRGVDVEAGAPLESGDLGERRHDLDVPVIVGRAGVVEGRGVEHEVVRRIVE